MILPLAVRKLEERRRRGFEEAQMQMSLEGAGMVPNLEMGVIHPLEELSLDEEAYETPEAWQEEVLRRAVERDMREGPGFEATTQRGGRNFSCHDDPYINWIIDKSFMAYMALLLLVCLLMAVILMLVGPQAEGEVRENWRRSVAIFFFVVVGMCLAYAVCLGVGVMVALFHFFRELVRLGRRAPLATSTPPPQGPPPPPFTKEEEGRVVTNTDNQPQVII